MQTRLGNDYDCVDEVPLHRVRGNQLGILISVIASVAIHQIWILVLPLIIQLISRSFGIRYNLFVRILSPIFPVSVKTESRDLLRFNNLLAIFFLAVTLVASLLNWTVVSYVSLGMLTVAVVLALSGFCLGCFIYFQWKRYWVSRKASS